jgi:hypothetical protein
MKTRFLGVVPVAVWFLLAACLTPALQAEEADLAQLRAKAEKGNVLAQYNLGLAYADGTLGPKDPVEAYVWLRLAADNGGTGTALGTLVHQMSIEDIAAGRRRLDELRTNMPSVVAARRGASPTPTGARGRPSAPPPAPTEDRFAAMQEELAALRVDKAQLTQQLASLRGAPGRPNASGAPADPKKVADLGAQLAAVRKELAAALKANEDLAARGKKLLEEQEGLKRQLADRGDAAKQGAAARSELGEARRELEAGKTRLAELEHLRQEKAQLQAEKEVLTAANQRLEQQGRAAAGLPRELAEARSAIEQLKKEKAELQAQRAGPAGGPAPAASAAPAAPASTPAATGGADELARLKDELNRANSKVDMTVRSYALLREENERLKARLAQTKAP